MTCSEYREEIILVNRLPSTVKIMNKTLLQRYIVVSILAFWLGQIFAFFLSEWMAGVFPKWYSGIQSGLMLMMMWLVVTAAMRQLQSFNDRIIWWQLLLAGAAIVIGGVLLYWLFLAVYGIFSIGWEALTLPLELLLLYSGLGMVVTLLTLIKLKIKDRSLGNVLEAVLMIGVLLLVLYLAT